MNLIDEPKINKKIVRGFNPSSRYVYDNKLITKDGQWMQFDTSQDASYHGCWINPYTLETFTYLEGDTIHVKCASEKDFTLEVQYSYDWQTAYANGDDSRIGIDPGWHHERHAARLKELNIDHLVH